MNQKMFCWIKYHLLNKFIVVGRPYCSSDKGQIENIHRLLRYWIKKGVSIDKISQNYLNQVVNIINDYPREIYQSGKLMSAMEFSKKI